MYVTAMTEESCMELKENKDGYMGGGAWREEMEGKWYD